jgi:hypothetical protein
MAKESKTGVLYSLAPLIPIASYPKSSDIIKITLGLSISFDLSQEKKEKQRVKRNKNLIFIIH